MTPAERRATTGLASIFGLRMLGMFIVLPVFALYAETLPGGADHTLVGLALGAYGLTQAVLQIPFGWASDRWGRKPVIVAGLVIFALGSFVAAWAPTIGWTIVGRTLQGAGAISAAVIALTADLTRDAVRTRAMAAIGMTIGATFALSLVAGPLLTTVIGVPGIFVLTGVLALAAIVAAAARGARARRRRRVAPRPPGNWRRVLADAPAAAAQLRHLRAARRADGAVRPGPVHAARQRRSPPPRHWLVYLPVLLGSVVLMLPALWQADRPGRGKPMFIGAVALLFVGQALLALAGASLRADRRRAASCSSPRSTCSRPCCRRSSPSTRRRRSRAPRSASTRACSSSAPSSAPPPAAGCRSTTVAPRSSASASR